MKKWNLRKQKISKKASKDLKMKKWKQKVKMIKNKNELQKKGF